METTFFEVLGAANIERIHSQMLSWLFNSDTLSNGQKSALLADVFGGAGPYSGFSSQAEYEGVDVVIRADEDVFVVENKLKISEHDDQLSRYEQLVESKGPELFPGMKLTHFVYLSLIPEMVKAKRWKATAYGGLLSALKAFVFPNPMGMGQYALNEYVSTLDHLVRVFKLFDENHTRFRNVFEEGSKKRSAKIGKEYQSDEQRYVADNQLETIFQKYFLQKVAIRLGLFPRCFVSESHGVANLQTVERALKIGGRTFRLGIQFQGESVKLNLMPEDYKSSSVSEVPTNVVRVFERLAAKHRYRFNKGRSKGYVSISTRLGATIWETDFDKLTAVYLSRLKECRGIIAGMDLGRFTSKR